MEGEAIYHNPAKFKGLVLDLCKDNSLHTKTFRAIIENGVPAQILAISGSEHGVVAKLGRLEKKQKIILDEKPSDNKVHYIITALYYGLTEKNARVSIINAIRWNLSSSSLKNKHGCRSSGLS